MTSTNIQVRVPEVLDREIEKLTPVSKSEFVRQAIQEKINRERDKKLDQAWIKALNKKKSKKKNQEVEDWLKAECWGDS